MEKKYFKPKSVTWWGAILAIVQGAIMIYQGDSQTGFLTINAGLATIGIRGAI